MQCEPRDEPRGSPIELAGFRVRRMFSAVPRRLLLMVSTPGMTSADRPKDLKGAALPGRGSRLRRTMFRVVLPLGAFFVALLMAEGALRARAWWKGWTQNCYAPQLTLYRDDPQLGFGGLKPGYRFRSATTSIGVNSLGFRGPEIESPKRAGVFRIFLVGGSSVFGYLVSDEDTSSVRLERYLRERVKRPIVEVVNAGVPAYNTMHDLVRYWYQIRLLEPDLVVYYQGYNDLGYITQMGHGGESPAVFGGLGGPSGCEELLAQSALYGFLRFRVGLFNRGSAGPAVQLADAPGAQGLAVYEQNLRLFAEAVGLSGARLVVCSQAIRGGDEIGGVGQDFAGGSHFGLSAKGFSEAVRRLREIQRKVAGDKELPFVDLYAAIPPTDEYFGDEVHLSVRGEERLAEVLGAALLENALIQTR